MGNKDENSHNRSNTKKHAPPTNIQHDISSAGAKQEGMIEQLARRHIHLRILLIINLI
jgi:hypothetical protein